MKYNFRNIHKETVQRHSLAVNYALDSCFHKKLMKKVKNISFTPLSEYFFSDWHELNIKI